MEEVGGPVERVNYPDQSVDCQVGTQFLAYDLPRGRPSLECLGDDLLRFLVDFGYEVTASFEGPACWTRRALYLPKVVPRAFGGGPGPIQ
jgi:hypothetical protein